MERFWNIVKAHPWLIGGAVLACVLLIWYFGSSSSSTTAVDTGDATASDQLAASVDENLASQQANAAISVATIQANSQNAQVAAAQEVTDNQTAAVESILNNQTQSATTLGTAQIAAAQEVTDAQTAATVSLAGIQSGMETSLATINGNNALALQQNNNNTYLAALPQLISGQNQANVLADTTALQSQSMAEQAGFTQSIIQQQGFFANSYNLAPVGSALTSLSKLPAGL